jgi:hypothetical protein
MRIKTLLPPPDLLKQVDGLEQGLRNSKRAGWLGWAGLTASVVASVLKLFPIDGRELGSGWSTRPVIAFAALVIVAFSASVYFLTRSHLWRKESEEAFRYTCHVGDFQSAGGTEALYPQLSTWLEFDLETRLNDRIGRLSFFEQSPPPGDEGGRSHIEIDGEYLMREKGDERIIEVTPRVRVGGPDEPQTLAYPVTFSLGSRKNANPSDSLDAGDPLEDDAASDEKRAPIYLEHYAKLLERVYFSVATQIYRQIRTDVQAKIKLLPTRFLRATAYLHEADDYARSNTLDAYDEARTLYDEGRKQYDPRLRILPHPAIRRPYQVALRAKAWCSWRIRRKLANVWPRLGKLEVLTTRAEIGYASSLLHRRVLATMSGHRVNPIYEARPVLQDAIDRLKKLPPEVPGNGRRCSAPTSPTP